jgi:CRP/FNR family transcriptional regulator, cyclic AMP receptor protein
MSQREHAGSRDQRGWGAWQWPPSSLLGSLASPSRDRLLEPGTTRQYVAGRVLMREGDTTKFVVVLLDGVVKVTGLTLDGKEALLAIRVGGDIVGEFAAFDEGPRSSTVTTCGAVVGRVIRQAEFLAALRRDSLLVEAVNRAVVGKARAANARRVEFAGYDAPTRLARVLRELAVRYGERSGNRVVIAWPLTQPELASLAAVAEPTAQKALRALRGRGVIATGYRSLTIVDLDALNRIAGVLPGPGAQLNLSAPTHVGPPGGLRRGTPCSATTTPTRDGGRRAPLGKLLR